MFMAVELDSRVISALERLSERLRPVSRDVKWVTGDRMHLTVKFLGEVADCDVASVSSALGQAAAASEKFSMDIESLGCFPTDGPVRVIWAGVDEPSGVLRSCAAKIEDLLEPLGFPRERRSFSAHITIGRVRDDRSGRTLRDEVGKRTLTRMTQHVTSLTLMSSVLSSKAPTYSRIGRLALGRTSV